MSAVIESNEPSSKLGPGPRTTLRRRAQRGSYDKASIYAIIDEALICHVAFTYEGDAHVLPTAHARLGDRIILHGAVANRMLSSALLQQTCCITFTHLDGLVLARSAYHHSMNYRSAVVYGRAEEVKEPAAKRAALDALVEHVAKGRSREARAANEHELHATQVLSVEILEASAKVRSGGVVDDAEDVAVGGVWAGVVPLEVRAGTPERDPDCDVHLGPDDAALQRTHALGARLPQQAFHLGLTFSSEPTRLDFSWLHRSLSQTYWAEGVSPEEVRTSFENSLVFGAYTDAGEQVACARVISDGARIGYLADVFVEPGRRRQGIGQHLVQFALEHPEVSRLGRVLLKTVDAQPLYERMGFVPSVTGSAMVLLRR